MGKRVVVNIICDLCDQVCALYGLEFRMTMLIASYFYMLLRQHFVFAINCINEQLLSETIGVKVYAKNWKIQSFSYVSAAGHFLKSGNVGFFVYLFCSILCAVNFS